MLIRDAIDRAIRRLRAAGVDEARQDAWLLLARIRGQDRAALMAASLEGLGGEDWHRFRQLVERRAAREPIAQIFGEKEFWSLDFRINGDVLCPRPDSECLIEAALAEVERRSAKEVWPGRILDLGTGSGCLLLALLSECPAASGVGVDLSEQALAIARTNGERLQLQDRVHWLCADWGRALGGQFDLIVTNPPYIKAGDADCLAPEVRDFEPSLALFAGDQGLDAYRSLSLDLHHRLAADGVACLEVGLGQIDDVETILQDCGLAPIGRWQDLAGIDRCIMAKRR